MGSLWRFRSKSFCCCIHFAPSGEELGRGSVRFCATTATRLDSRRNSSRATRVCPLSYIASWNKGPSLRREPLCSHCVRLQNSSWFRRKSRCCPQSESTAIASPRTGMSHRTLTRCRCFA